MDEYKTRKYNNDEVNRIIRRALKLKQDDMISHQDLIDTALEVGIDTKILETAIEQEHKEFKLQQIRLTRLKQRKLRFYSRLWCYLIVNAGLLLIDYLTPGSWWFQWSVIGWGIGLAFHFKAVYYPGHPRRGVRRKIKYAYR